MTKEDAKKRIIELTAIGEKTVRSARDYYVDEMNFLEFRSSTLTFLRNFFGEKHVYYKEFEVNVNDLSPANTRMGIGILKAVNSDIENGWLSSYKDLISADIFADFLEMAEYLLDENYKDAAAVMTGSVLEEHLRNLCAKNGISTDVTKVSKTTPKKADTMNADLKKQGVFGKLEQKNITAWLDLRNKAAHGKYSEYTKEQVRNMFDGVSHFISRYK